MTKWVECNVGQERHAGKPQSEKDCEKCVYFERDLAADHLCGQCYESEDKHDYSETGDVRCGEMEYPSERVCETPSGEGRL